MPDDFNYVSPGDPIRGNLTAGGWNAAMDAAEYVRQRQFNVSSDPRSPRRLPVVVKLHNNLTTELGRFSVVGLGQPIILPTDNEDEFDGNFGFQGEEPNGVRITAIVQDPLTVDEIGTAVIVGTSRVLLKIAHLDHKYASPISGDTAKMTSSGSGPALILWRETGAVNDDVKAVVLLDRTSPGRKVIHATPDVDGLIDAQDADVVILDSGSSIKGLTNPPDENRRITILSPDTSLLSTPLGLSSTYEGAAGTWAIDWGDTGSPVVVKRMFELHVISRSIDWQIEYLWTPPAWKCLQMGDDRGIPNKDVVGTQVDDDPSSTNRGLNLQFLPLRAPDLYAQFVCVEPGLPGILAGAIPNNSLHYHDFGSGSSGPAWMDNFGTQLRVAIFGDWNGDISFLQEQLDTVNTTLGGLGGLATVSPAGDPGDAGAPTGGSAGATYTTAEQDIINSLVADVAALTTALNGLIGSLRTAGVIA